MGRESVCGVRKSEASGSYEPWHLGLSWSSRWVSKCVRGHGKVNYGPIRARASRPGLATVTTKVTNDTDHENENENDCDNENDNGKDQANGSDDDNDKDEDN